jgi:hypothetical protein
MLKGATTDGRRNRLAQKALFRAARGVKSDADDDKNDAEHSNGSNEFH